MPRWIDISCNLPLLRPETGRTPSEGARELHHISSRSAATPQHALQTLQTLLTFKLEPDSAELGRPMMQRLPAACLGRGSVARGRCLSRRCRRTVAAPRRAVPYITAGRSPRHQPTSTFDHRHRLAKDSRRSFSQLSRIPL